MKRKTFWCVCIALTLLVAPVSVFAFYNPGEDDRERVEEAYGKAPYSPYAGRKYPSRPLFGDTHLHTGFSMDAGVWGATLKPRDAYRFARGEQVTSSTGQPVKLSRPLDFLAVSSNETNDHSC